MAIGGEARLFGRALWGLDVQVSLVLGFVPVVPVAQLGLGSERHLLWIGLVCPSQSRETTGQVLRG